MPQWLENLLPIILLLVVVAFVLARLPKVELGHSPAFLRRRFFNWFPLGMTYAFLYFGRYNLAALNSMLDKADVLTKSDFGIIDGVSSVAYGIAFIINGPLTDRWGGRVTILIATAGSALMNILIGLVFLSSGGTTISGTSSFWILVVLFSMNMYFQSFGAVSIVKVNAPWFHVRERGVLGGVFGILISLGLYFAYDWSRAIASALSVDWAFFIPAILLIGFFILDYFVICDTPSKAGHKDFDTADASSGDTGEVLSTWQIAKNMFSQNVIIIIIAIEFCSGFLRNAIMKWYITYAGAISYEGTVGALKDGFVTKNWGLVLCIAGILGGTFAGFISDHVFGSRRGPVASVLYGGMLLGSISLMFLLGSPMLGWTIAFMSLCVIGVHGMLSGTASMDFGGRKNAGLVTGIIDGFVYLGTGFQGLLYAAILPKGDAAKNPDNWSSWPLAMIPFALVGFLLALKVWNAKPKSKSAAAH
jgi:MFS transporter, OPA family, glycerol-3-phosphate transporter